MSSLIPYENILSNKIRLLLLIPLSLTCHIFLGFAAKILNYPFIDSTTLNLYSIGAYTSTSTQLSVALTEYNVITQASTTSNLIYPYASSYQFAIVSANTVFAVLQSSYSLYAPKVSGAC